MLLIFDSFYVQGESVPRALQPFNLYCESDAYGAAFYFIFFVFPTHIPMYMLSLSLSHFSTIYFLLFASGTL